MSHITQSVPILCLTAGISLLSVNRSNSRWGSGNKTLSHLYYDGHGKMSLYLHEGGARTSNIAPRIKKIFNSLRFRWFTCVWAALNRPLFKLVNQYLAELFLECVSSSPYTVASNCLRRKLSNESPSSRRYHLFVTDQVEKTAWLGWATNAVHYNDVADLSEDIRAKPAKQDSIPLWSSMQYTS